MRPDHLVLLLATLVFGELQVSWSSSLANSIQPPITDSSCRRKN